MANLLSTSLDYTYNGREVIDVLVKPTVQSPNFKRLFNLRTGVRNGDQLFLATPPTKVLREKTTCALSEATGINITNRKLSTVQTRLHFEQCEQAFQDTIFERALKSGTDVDNLTGTDLERIMKEIYMATLEFDMFRLASFGDTSDSDDFYGILEGIWPTLITGLSDYTVTQSSTQFSDGTTFTSSEAYDVFVSLYEDADPILKQLPPSEKAIYVTGNVHDNYIKYLESQSNEAGQRTIVEGLAVPTFRGIPVIPIYDWDTALADASNPFDSGVNKLALYTTPSNHIIGVDGANDDARIETWFSQDDRVVKMLTEFRWGYQYAHGGLQIIALNE